MKELIYFCITFLIVYMIYYFVSIRKAKKDLDKLPVEVRYLILCYNIDIKLLPSAFDQGLRQMTSTI